MGLNRRKCVANDDPHRIQFRVKGQLDEQWSTWFEGFSIEPQDHGDTLITGVVSDQAELFGIMKKFRDLGIELISFNPIESRWTYKIQENKMNATNGIPFLEERKALFSVLWIYLSLNYIYCDHLALMEPGILTGLIEGRIGSIQLNTQFLLGAAFLMQIPFVMIVLSRILKFRANRWANILAGAIMAIVQISTMWMGSAPSPTYLFYSVIEIACNLLIVWLAWNWRNPEYQP